MPTVRPADAADADFLVEMLVLAADWRPGASPRSVAELMAEPAVAHYVDGWPRAGDVGFVAEVEQPVGATWWRFLPADDAGYGFVDNATPELSIAVVAAWRGRGIGTLLLDALVGEARRRQVAALSLSVEIDNPAAAWYRRLGFEPVGVNGGAHTMLLDLR